MAVDQGMITNHGGVQAELDRIFKKEEFRALLSEQLGTHGLKGNDVRWCLSIIYSVLSCFAHGHDRAIVLRGLYHPDNEIAGLIAIMRVQGHWKHPLNLRVEAAEVISYTGSVPTMNKYPPSAPLSTKQVPTTGQRASSNPLQPRVRKT